MITFKTSDILLIMTTERPQTKELDYRKARLELVDQLRSCIEEGAELKNKVYLVPGGNRIEGSIGGAITLALAMKEATVIIPHIHDNEDTQAQIKELQWASKLALGGEIVALQADITDSESRATLFQHIKETYGRLDGIFFLPAGGIRGTDEEAENLNVKAPVETALLYEQMFGETTLFDRGLFVTIPSTPSKYLSLPMPIDRYQRTAHAKHEGDMRLDKMSEALSDVGIKRVSLISGPVIDTSAMNLMMRKMSDEQIAQLHDKSNTNGEHRTPMRVDVAVSALNLALDPWEARQNVFVGVSGLDRPQIAEILYMYGPNKLLLDDFMNFGENEAVATMKVTLDRMKPTFTDDEIELIDEYIAQVKITDNHVAGHFDAASGLPSVLRGVDQIAVSLIAGAKMEMASFIRRGYRDQNKRVALGGIFDPIQFVNVVRPGDTLKIKSDAGDLKGSFYAEETILTTEKSEIAQIETMVGEWIVADETRLFPSEQIIEAAAQTLGLLYSQSREMSDRLPLLKSIEDVDFFDQLSDLTVDSTIEFRALMTKSGKSLFEGNVEFFIDGKKRGVITGINCKVVPKERLIAMLEGTFSE